MDLFQGSKKLKFYFVDIDNVFHANGDSNPKNILPKKRKTAIIKVGRAKMIMEPRKKAQIEKDKV